MPRVLIEAKLTTRNARLALPKGLHWRQIDTGVHLGYRKGLKGGHWLVRFYLGNGNYHRLRVGTADDFTALGTLSYDQAAKRGRDIVADVRARAERAQGAPSETIRSVVQAYIEMRDARVRALGGSGRRCSDASSRLTRHVLKDELADIELSVLTEQDLFGWKARLAPDAKASSRIRTASDLKAALNLAHRKHRKQFPADFPEVVKSGLARDKVTDIATAGARESQILTDEVVRDIVAAATSFDEDGDLGRMILVLAATGARFSQVQRIIVGDVQPDRMRIFVPTSRKGQNRVADHYVVQVGPDVIEALAPVLEGRAANEPLLCRWRYVQVKATEWRRDRRGAWTSASEITRPWKAICDELKLKDVVPYALRHSSIVRAIRLGLPIRLVAALHDTSVVMIERHYARFIVDGLEELAARAVVPLLRRASLGR